MTSRNNTQLVEPLLTKQNDGATSEHAEQMNLLLKFKRSSMLFGFILGVFIQFSTLGANWLIISLFGKDAIISATKGQLFAYSLIWSALTSAMSIWILKFLRDLVNVVLVHRHDSVNASSHDLAKLEILMIAMEGRFVGGALAGVCSAWTLTDYLLGLHVQMAYSLITLLVASFWACFLLRTYSVQAVDEVDTESTEDSSNNAKTYQVTLV